ncbi:MAG TPA: hypothetical protein PKA19_02710 [Bacillota bacterium]|nr:hypothetical protein [Bacillota bacterium]
MLNYDVCIFTEGGSKAGLGHITRCLALYDELERRGLNSLFIINAESTVGEVLGKRNYIIDRWIENWPDYFSEKNSFEKSCIVDSYLADEAVYSGIQRKSVKALFLDDTNRIDYPEGIIVNPSIFGRDETYVRKAGRQYLTGPNYVILRREFQQSDHRRVKNFPSDILIILGGSDVKGLTPEIIRALNKQEFDGLKKHVVIGKAFTNIKDIEGIAKACQNIKLYYNLDAAQLYKLMRKCDLAVTAAGQTTNELIAARLPFLCIQIADNQKPNMEGLLFEGLIYDYIDSDTKKFNLIRFEELLRDLMEGKARKRIAAKMDKFDLSRGVKNIIDCLLSK